ncbi:UDP-glucose 4-epimerase, partial [Enterococcus faecalis]
LNYDKNFVEGTKEITQEGEYNSDNRQRFSIEQIKERLLELVYVKKELKEWQNK